MKKIIFLVILLTVGVLSNAQKKNGTVYSEHPTIETTKAVMKALQDGDENGFVSFFADSVYVVSNGKGQKRSKEYIRGTVKYWSAFYNLEIKDAKPAYPDAIEYKGGEIWVQDWLLFTATHKKTGINIAENFHHMYRFNDDGKIDVLSGYFNNDIFQEIVNSQTTKENGKVYINHPYILKVRRLINALCAKDLDEWSDFFTPDAKLSNIMTEWGKTYSVDEVREYYEGLLPKIESIQMKQVGYPDCIYFEEGDYHVVYSWWINTWIMKDGTKKEFPSMFSHAFNKDGKIVYDRLYVSSNHLE